MDRRRFLATVATAAVGATAGCGYAPGGGDVSAQRDVLRERLEPPVVAVDGDGVVVAESTVVRDDEDASDDGQASDGEPIVHPYRPLPSGTAVVRADRAGRQRWRHEHAAGDPAAVATGDRTYLLDDEDHLVAIDASASEDGGGDDRSADATARDGPHWETTEAWRVELDAAARPPVAAVGDVVFASLEASLVRVAGGEVRETIDLPGGVEALHATDDRLVVATDGAALGFDADGERRWQVDLEGPVRLASGGGRTAIRTGRPLRSDVDLVVVRTDDGERLWSRRLAGAASPPAVCCDAVYAAEADGVVAFDAADGTERWRVPVDSPPTSLVPAPEGAYGAGADCEFLAVDADGVRWRRALDDGRCDTIAGWRHDDVVAFLTEYGEVVSLYRIDQSPPDLF